MKIQNKTVFPVMAVLAIVLTLAIPPAFADNVSVSIPAGSSTPGCETTNECFIPDKVSINVGDEVTWSNDDTAAHTVTAGSAADGPSGVFDSSLFMAGTTFSHTFDAEGEFPYFCMVHPWMSGIVLVGAGAGETSSSPEPEQISSKPVMDSRVEVNLEHKISGGKVTSMIADGNTNSVIIEIDSTEAGEITVTLPKDVINAKIGNEDDEFFVLVDNEESLFDETKTSTDRILTIGFPPGTEKIEIIGTFAIPEFETIAAMILGVGIISIIGLSVKSKLIVIPKI